MDEFKFLEYCKEELGIILKYSNSNAYIYTGFCFLCEKFLDNEDAYIEEEFPEFHSFIIKNRTTGNEALFFFYDAKERLKIIDLYLKLKAVK